MAARETIDIEALLHRAYGQYRVHKVTPASVLGLRMRSGGPSPLASAMATIELGTRVDVSGAGARLAGLQAMNAATPDDMLTVHDAVLALSDWLIEGANSEAPVAWRRAEIAQRGWLVEKTGTGLWLVRPGEGPKGADAWVALTDPHLAAMVILHAERGDRPDWDVRDVRPARGRGRPSADAGRARAETLAQRAVYALWRAALGELVAGLAGLERHAVTGPVAPVEPWNRPAVIDRAAENALSPA